MIIGKGCILKIIAVAFTAILGLAILFLAFGEKFLRIEDGLSHTQADAIVIMAGNVGESSEDGQRIHEGAGLFNHGRGQYIILPLRHATITWPWVAEHYRINHPIPEDRLLIGRATPSDEQTILQYGGTYAEARKSVEIMRQHRMESAIIVSVAHKLGSIGEVLGSGVLVWSVDDVVDVNGSALEWLIVYVVNLQDVLISRDHPSLR